MTLSDALEQVVLMPYRKLISALEKDLLRDHFLNVTYLQSSLENVSRSSIYILSFRNSIFILVFFTIFKNLWFIE